MNIKFKKLIINNFLSIGKGEITLENRGYTLIKGINNNSKDNALSNGAGKSTIFNALSYALVGETIQGISSNLKNMYTKEDMSVELIFSIDKDEFRIIRTKDDRDRSNLKIYLNNTDISGKGLRESEAILKTYLPQLTSELIGEVIIIGQGMPHKFSNNTPSRRKEILESFSNNDVMMSDIKERVEKRYNVLLEAKNKIDKAMTEKETTKKLYEDNYKDICNKLNKLKVMARSDYNTKISQKEKLVEELKNKKDNSQNKYLKLFEEYNSFNSKYLDLKNKKLEDIENERKIFESFHSPLLKQQFEDEFSLKTLISTIKQKEKITDICPTCGQKLKGVEKPDLSKDYALKEELSLKLNNTKEKLAQQEKSFELNKKDIEDRYVEEMKNLKENIINAKEIEYKKEWDNLKEVEKELDSANKELAKLITDNEVLASKSKELESNALDLENKIEAVKKDLLYNIEEGNNLKTHLDIVNKINIYVKRDFRGILLSNIINYINIKSKEFAKEIFENDEIDFLLNGNNIDIKYCNKNLDNLSGGEQQKVDLIIQFAIRDMMQEYTGFNSNIIVLDEILDNLDSKGCDSVLTFITNRLSDIESIFIISHHADSLNICNDSTIKVIKNNGGISYINEE